MDTKSDSQLMKKAAAVLARRACSRGELRKKLAGAGAAAQLELTLDRLEQLNLLNDADYAYNFALYRMQQQGWSPSRVTAALLGRDVARPLIDDALQRIESEAGTASILAAYITRHCHKQGLPATPKDVARLCAHLLRRGFDENQIWNVLRRMLPSELFRRFETGD